jgi:ribokinase
LPDSLLAQVDILTPNEVEAKALVDREVGGLDAAIDAGRQLVERGVGQAIVTRGRHGGVCVDRSGHWTYVSPSVEAVDSTAAGDCFAGALATALAEDRPPRDAVEFAAHAAARSVTRLGAQTSLPRRDELTLNS